MSEQMYGAQQQIGQQALSKRDTVNGVAIDLDQSIQRAAKLFEALRHIGDRLDGSRPEPVGNVAQETPPGSMILDMRRKQTTLSNYLGKCEDETQRLAQALGIS